MPVQLLDRLNFAPFIAAKLAAAVHFDANWNVDGQAATRRKMEAAERALADRVNFGEVDCDRTPELAKAIPLLNVPSVAYYREGKLIGTLIGAGQDVRDYLERVLRGEPIEEETRHRVAVSLNCSANVACEIIVPTSFPALDNRVTSAPWRE